MKRRVGVILVSLFHKDYVPRYIIMKEKAYLAPEEMKKSMCKFEKVSRTAAPSENAQMVHSSEKRREGEKRREDEKIWNGDIQMLRSDLNTLRGQAWLNDAVIEFMFSIFQDLMDDTILLVPPSLSRLLGKSEIAPNIYNDLQISLRSLVLLAINDMQESDGGDVGLHWSLLAVE
ncbi:hypothetical protein GQ55_5G094800 [Panicum hallii var. hallii]|uniref:Ubiquitin-like protease family profile domain-containing protein n=1 Tax=Panicum hallii var. hallii TaxID=1504633 RepID=A0A2T7DEL1_9POAL|nr:hypothetical protein GQ55_5G094800 [Panicum hallii var. hallii]